jgi:hypothetical protein
MAKNTAKLTPEARPKVKTDKVVEALPRGSAKQAGSSILLGTVANINGFLANPDAVRMSEYERAFTTDETIAGALDFIQLSLLASLGDYQHPRADVRRFVQENLNMMEGNFRQAIGEMILSSLWSGFACSEMIWTVDGQHLWLQRMANYHPNTIYMSVDRNGYLTEGGEPMMPGAKEPGVYQLSPIKGWGTYIPIPLNKVCIMSHRKRHNNYYGESIIRRVYKLWKYKDPGLEMWAIALDRYGTPVTYIIAPNLPTGREVGDSYAEGGKRAETIADSAAYALANMHTGTGIVLENPDPQNDIKIGTITTGNNYGTSFENFLDYLNSGIYRGLLIPELVFRGGAGGLNSTAKTHFAIYQSMVRALYSQFVEPFTEQVIGRLIRYNFNEPNPGSFPMLPFDPTTAETLANTLDKMVQVGAVDTSDLNDLNIVRQMVGLPVRQETAIDSIDQVVVDHRQANKTKIDVARIRAKAQLEVAGMRADAMEDSAAIRTGSLSPEEATADNHKPNPKKVELKKKATVKVKAKQKPKAEE